MTRRELARYIGQPAYSVPALIADLLGINDRGQLCWPLGEEQPR